MIATGMSLQWTGAITVHVFIYWGPRFFECNTHHFFIPVCWLWIPCSCCLLAWSNGRPWIAHPTPFTFACLYIKLTLVHLLALKLYLVMLQPYWFFLLCHIILVHMPSFWAWLSIFSICGVHKGSHLSTSPCMSHGLTGTRIQWVVQLFSTSCSFHASSGWSVCLSCTLFVHSIDKSYHLLEWRDEASLVTNRWVLVMHPSSVEHG